jgi:RHS repeat-associated protein
LGIENTSRWAFRTPLALLLLLTSGAISAAEPPADIYKKILPAIEFLLNSDTSAVVWTLTPPVSASYEVFARWVVKPGNTSTARYTVYHSGGATAVAVNQQANGGQWVSLGTFNLAPSQNHRVELSGSATGTVIADAVRISSPTTMVQGTIVHNVFADHLDTPRAITTAADTPQVVWRWENDDPFGANAPNENPSGLGAFENNLRSSGQYFDKETNLHYNYQRDYDPAIGRYIQSDPIGLDGGINTYAYVNSNPLSFSDPEGLMGFGGGGAATTATPVWGKGGPQGPVCPPDDCPNPISITLTPNSVCRAGDVLCGQAMQAAGLQPPYFPETRTATYSGVCLLKFGVGFTGGKFVAGTVALNQAPNIATRIGLSAVNVARVTTAASALNSPPAMVVGSSLAIAAVLEKCECRSK